MHNVKFTFSRNLDSCRRHMPVIRIVVWKNMHGLIVIGYIENYMYVVLYMYGSPTVHLLLYVTLTLGYQVKRRHFHEVYYAVLVKKEKVGRAIHSNFVCLLSYLCVFLFPEE
jgi:hypothetical protein